MPVSREQLGPRVGFWDMQMETESGDMTWTLDIDAYIRDARAKMRNLEEKITRDLVVEKLRELGYTVHPLVNEGTSHSVNMEGES